MNIQNNEQLSPQVTHRLNNRSTDLPEFSSQISLGNTDGDTPYSFLPTTQQENVTSNYSLWSSEQNKLLLTRYFHFSNDSELGNGKKGDNFWNKITTYLNEHSPSGPHRSRQQCKSHHRELKQKIGIWVGVFRKALSERKSGWSDDDYIESTQKLFVGETKKRFTLVDEWKLVRNEPKYMVGSGISGSSGSKRKSSEADNIPSPNPSFERPEGRDATKKKKRGSASKTKGRSKLEDEEYSKIIADLGGVNERKEQQLKVMQEVADAQKEMTRAKKMDIRVNLKQRKDLDEDEQELASILKTELFGR